MRLFYTKQVLNVVLSRLIVAVATGINSINKSGDDDGLVDFPSEEL